MTARPGPLVPFLFFKLSLLVGEIESHVNVLLWLAESHFSEEMKRWQVFRLSIRKQHTYAAFQHEILEMSE